MTASILIVDDDTSQRDILTGYLRKKGFGVFAAESGEKALGILQEQIIDIVLSDFRMPSITGMDLLDRVLKINPEIVFVMITAYGTVEDAVRAMRAGAYDYICKPIDLSELDLLLKRALDHRALRSENRQLKEQLRDENTIRSIVSRSAAMEQVLNIAARAADSNATVLITGENGTGKDVVAKAIHCASRRRDGPFVAINIPALSENIIESELFGHEKGAFTGADRLRVGRFELASGGTIFLDEIGYVSPSTQVKLLRTLQEHTIERVGGTESIPIDVRILAATNQALEERIAEGTFREDLFYRLNIIQINIPPLRERRDDIIPLVEDFLGRFVGENGKGPVSISREAIDRLMRYDYPGNVRELENIIERAVVLCRNNLITEEDLSLRVRGFADEDPSTEDTDSTLRSRVEHLERSLIYDALRRSNRNQTKAGEILGITERNLRYKMQKYGMKN